MRRFGTFAVALVVLAGAGGDDGGETTMSEQGAAAVATTTTGPTRTKTTHLTLDLVDPTRPTEAGAGMPHRAERRLVTEVYLPAGQGPFPFIAFAHGLNGHPRKFSELLTAWADAGYAVAAPTFPLSNDEVPGEATWTDVANQPGDISFVIDEVLAANQDPSSPALGAIDPERIGVAGLSLGGATTYGVAFNDCCLDDRPVAAMVLDGARLPVGGEFDLARGLPLLIVHADEDFALPYRNAVDAFAEAAAPKWFVTLHAFAHAEPFEDTRHPTDDLVRAATIAFWDRYLGDDASAEDRLVNAVTPAGMATLEADPG